VPLVARNETATRRGPTPGPLRSVAVAAALVTGVVVYFGGLLGSQSQDATGTAKSSAAAAASLLNGFAVGDTESYVRELEQRVEVSGRRDPKALSLLGLAYLQRVRESGDVSLYPRAEAALDAALAVDPENLYATTGLAALAASRHRFEEARTIAKRAIALSPHSPRPYGILGDALIETGRYRQAFAAFDRMVALRPSATGYARVSYARELLGDTAGAARAMKLAVTAAAPTAEPAAWALVQLGNLELGRGKLERAAHEFRSALARFPGYAPALGGLATVQLWLEHPAAAAQLYAEALERSAAAEYAVGLGDAYRALGRHSEAERAWKRGEDLEAAFARDGGRNDLETALFDLDHDRNFADALRRARIGHAERPSVEGEHVLAWALYKNGRCEEARRHSVRALRLGTKDTGAILHRSYMEECLGNREAAKVFRADALAVNPYALFTVGSPRQAGS
jgi:tetratricopeptide (TPR) repeat protein